ncbi:MAG: nucleotidyl transferase AbiEii/AbiGii toxin family protein, partial [Patescibacteria group bacterium]
MNLTLHLEALTPHAQNLFSNLSVFSDFYLAGGTALALQIGHRISYDFDLFSEKPIQKTLLVKIEKLFKSNKIIISVNNKDELTVYLEETKLTFLHYPFPIIKPLIFENNIALLSVPEIAATKAYTIGRRATYRDY